MTLRIDMEQLDDGQAAAALLRPFYERLMQIAWADAGAVLGMEMIADLANPFVVDTLASLARSIRGIAETTREQIRELVREGNEQGWSVTDLADRIIATGATGSEARAILIARTETASAYSQASILAYRESGVVSGIEWLTAGDPCPICDPLDGQIAALGKSFPGDIAHPPAHPGCRCAIAPVVV